MRKIISITILSLFLLVGLWQSCQAIELLIKDYPEIKTDTGTYALTGKSTLPEVIRYIYMFALGIAGFIALLMMIIGGIMYVFSAGNVSKAADAKDQIFSALLGVVILLASVLILRIINPDLINIGFTLPPIGGSGGTGNGGEHGTGCYCWLATGGRLFAGCYSDIAECNAPCMNICNQNNRDSICIPNDAENCP